MRIVKLDRRHRQFKEHGHTMALRFSDWSTEAQRYERAAEARLRGTGWNRGSSWYSYFGSRPTKYNSRPYWITFRNEQDLTIVLLSVTENNH